MAIKKGPAKKKRAATKGAAKPSGNDNICFTIMPFGGWDDYYYEEIYSPAIEAAGLVPRRADDFYRPSAITHDIWILTQQAKLILAVLTGKNPNVFYELGLGHALAKPAILVIEASEEVPFDLRSLRVIEYDKNEPAWGEMLYQSVSQAIKEVMESPKEAILPTFLTENQIDSLKQELNQLKRESAPAGGADSHPAKPRMTFEDAMKFARRSLEKRAPSVFIESVLKDSGFDDETIRSIVAKAQPLVKSLTQPPAKNKS